MGLFGRLGAWQKSLDETRAARLLRASQVPPRQQAAGKESVGPAESVPVRFQSSTVQRLVQAPAPISRALRRQPETAEQPPRLAVRIRISAAPIPVRHTSRPGSATDRIARD